MPCLGLQAERVHQELLQKVETNPRISSHVLRPDHLSNWLVLITTLGTTPEQPYQRVLKGEYCRRVDDQERGH